jgi:glutathione synthase/RimK-type ligase-like ATP-grasp enzyme
MTLWCYVADRGNWGQQIIQMAIARGLDARPFTEPSDDIRRGDYVFMRIPQWQPELDVGKTIATTLYQRGCIMIPDMFTIRAYEDKAMQTRAYFNWMPETRLIHGPYSIREAITAVHELGLPFVSKSREASASTNVRLIKTLEEATKEFDTVMNSVGLDIRIGKGRTGKQKGYLIWQKFCAGNDCDYRAVVTGRHVMLLRRFNKHGTPFASGSGRNEPVNYLDTPELVRMYGKALEFFYENDLKWNGIDLVCDKDDNEWKVLETTLGWSQAAYAECLYIGTAYRGRQIFELFLDELEQGVFR